MKVMHLFRLRDDVTFHKRMTLFLIVAPHKGVKFVDIACYLPDVIYKGIAKAFNKYFKLIGGIYLDKCE